jgi:hypothetical protein
VNERKRRIGENEALFREINEQARTLTSSFSVASDDLKVVCECGAPRCLDEILVPLAEYARIRDDPTLFVIKPGHDLPETETVTAKAKGHWIVRKDPGLPAAIARATDPR